MKNKIKQTSLFMGGILFSGIIISTEYITYAVNYDGGIGTSSNPYLISTPEQLNYLREEVNSGLNGEGVYFKLANDIDLSTYDTDADPSNGNWGPIGNSVSTPFKGNFDGGGHAIKNMEIRLDGENYVGLFGSVVSANITNLSIENAVVVGETNVGILAGNSGADNSEGLVSQVSVSGEVIASGDNVGGLIGYNNFGSRVENTYSLADVTGGYNVGGLVGANSAAGGILPAGSISTSYSAGNIVSANGSTGSVVGHNEGDIENIYFDQNKSITSASGGGVGLTTSQMSGSRAKDNLKGFDFDSVWGLTNEYPKFQWERGIGITQGESTVTLTGEIIPLIASVTVPTTNLGFVLDPNQEKDSQFIAPEFSIINETNTPIKLEIKSFAQTTSIFNDVLPDAHIDWDNLDRRESNDFALAIVPIASANWKSLIEGPRYVADDSNYEIGVINANSTVEFNFEAKHGTLFTKPLAPKYEVIFLFDFE